APRDAGLADRGEVKNAKLQTPNSKEHSGSWQFEVWSLKFGVWSLKFGVDDVVQEHHRPADHPVDRSSMWFGVRRPTGDRGGSDGLQPLHDADQRTAICGCLPDGRRRTEGVRRHRLPARSSAEGNGDWVSLLVPRRERRNVDRWRRGVRGFA